METRWSIWEPRAVLMAGAGAKVWAPSNLLPWVGQIFSVLRYVVVSRLRALVIETIIPMVSKHQRSTDLHFTANGCGSFEIKYRHCRSQIWLSPSLTVRIVVEETSSKPLGTLEALPGRSYARAPPPRWNSPTIRALRTLKREHVDVAEID
jgi:hypothetical protein